MFAAHEMHSPTIWSTGNWVFQNAAKEYALVSNQRASWLSGYFLIVSIAPMLLPVLHRLCRQLVFAIQTEHWIV